MHRIATIQASRVWRRLSFAGVGVALLMLIAGCHTEQLRGSRDAVSEQLVSRFGSGFGDQDEAGEALLPATVSLDDGVTEDEAVQIALWNNAAFQETLTQLGVSNARLLDAGLIADPQFSMFFPLGPKQLEFTTFQAVDALWLQAIRVKAAELDVDQVSQSMVQNGLDVIRDARIAHANFVAATEQAAVSREAAELRSQIEKLAQKRLDAGDISELEATTSRIDALQAKAAADRALHDVTLARDRLRVVIGLSMWMSSELQVQSLDQDASPASRNVDALALEPLLNEALAMRPDLRAAEIGIEAAGERAGLARNQFMNLDAIYDANAEGNRGFESGPGLRFTVPIFNGNQGGIAIAEAQWQQAVRRYVTVRDQITLEVRNSHTQVLQASENLATLRDEILPALREAGKLARRNYENGGTPYFLVLQTTGQYLDARLRELQLAADLRRASAELDRSVGHRVSTSSPNARLPQVPPVDEIVSRAAGHETSSATRPVWKTTLPVPSSAHRPQPLPAFDESDAADIPLRLNLNLPSEVTAAVHTSSPAGTWAPTRRSRAGRSDRKKKRRRDDRNSGETRSKHTDQDADNVQVTIDIRLDPRLVPSGVRASEGKPRKEDGTSED